MRTMLSRAIMTAAAAVTIGTMNVLPAAADWRDNHGGYHAPYHDSWFARRHWDERRHHHWFFPHFFFEFGRR
jgi:hypothetical protein